VDNAPIRTLLPRVASFRPMSIDESKARLIALIEDQSLKVIALMGPWGTGKTHLWQQRIKKDSADPKNQSSLYVSLFGVKELQLFNNSVLSEESIGLRYQSVVDRSLRVWRLDFSGFRRRPASTLIDRHPAGKSARSWQGELLSQHALGWNAPASRLDLSAAWLASTQHLWAPRKAG
jgi:hypothetical protein